MSTKLINCKACQKEIAKGVKKCPSCGKDQRGFIGRHKFLTVLAVLVILFAIGSLGSDSETALKTDITQTVAAPAKPVKEYWGIGEAVNHNGTALMVGEVKKSNGSEYDKPKSGYEYVIVGIVIRNDSKETISYNPFDFKMQNSQGQIIDGAFAMVNQDTQLQSGDLAVGGKVQGTLIYEQPKNDKKLTLIYTGNIFSTEGVKFKLN